MFVPILTDVLTIRLPYETSLDMSPRTGSYYEREGYRNIILLKVVRSLIGPKSYAVKGRVIQINLHLFEILEGDISRADIWLDHQFLAAVLETARFEPKFHKWISILYRSPTAVVPVNRSRLLSIGRFGRHTSVSLSSFCSEGLEFKSASTENRAPSLAPNEGFHVY